ncbi:hypothetical protein GCM10007978_01650 [Shewanella hanedai]|uniref:Uncharacterized protein n=1 Tax=Shewanella hanedai TaxID=25 RepID=A0A553JUZ1_SHEHA|nr:hypothetical protein [Shewanella hanedai]TRY16277.1 hypothetical protein FN961_01215 [Shewanella hanedai]GGI67651.1 hypothetical protein GCM10007978_01650 [Shewanella hanedai]
MKNELGLRVDDPVSPVSWIILGVICLITVIIWIYIKQKKLDPSNLSTSHQRFPLGGQCYLISIETEGKKYKLYETPRGLIKLDLDYQQPNDLEV